MATTWQQHGNDMVITCKSHGDNMAIALQLQAIARQWHGNDMAITWQRHGNENGARALVSGQPAFEPPTRRAP